MWRWIILGVFVMVAAGFSDFQLSTIAADLTDVSLGDQAKVAPRDNAIGYPSRDPNLDALPGFSNPPRGYGIVLFFWWIGDPITKERLSWQLDRLVGKGITGLQINYAHSDRGGRAYGLSIPSDPPLFSDAWWKLFGWFMGEAKKQGISVSLSDYTLGLGQGWFMDAALAENPELCGYVLSNQIKNAAGGDDIAWKLPDGWVAVTAYRVGEKKLSDGVDLRGYVKSDQLHWKTPDGKWQIVTVAARKAELSIDSMNPKSGPAIIKHFFQRFEDLFPGEGGKGLNFFFSDELEFRLNGWTWNDRFAEEFRKRKGYDITPELPALFIDIGPRTPKIRLDYNDVRVELAEAGYFRPVFEWHEKRGMIYGCDHGGRGRNVVEFGDYFRTQRWMSGPGSDQPGLARDIVKAKVASSIAHLYNRPRVWLEGYYGSGWGTTSAAVTDATIDNYLHGYNLLSLHGLYYSTHGGWWEWAPPCNHWRMPYWEHMVVFTDFLQRLSYLLSQGNHVCDIAIVYPVASVEAGMDGQKAVQAAFTAAEGLYRAGIDLDFIDFESLDRAEVRDSRLQVSGESYRVLVLPSMRAVRYSMLKKAADFVRRGGMVVSLGALPEASDRIGRDDPEVARLVEEIFGISAVDAASLKAPHEQKHPGGGVGLVADRTEFLIEAVEKAFTPDLKALNDKPVSFMHRRIGARDVYALHRLAKDTECFFRANGRAELWDAWTGTTRPLPVLDQTAEGTRLRLPLGTTDLQLIVFSPGEPIKDDARMSVAQPTIIPVEGLWACKLQPTLDNRWGDFRWPPSDGMIAAEARKFRYMAESSETAGWQRPDFDDSKWPRVTYAFGPMFHQLGPIPATDDVATIEKKLASLERLDERATATVGGKSYTWKPYDFSWRWGVEGDPGHQGYHGLKEEIYDEFIRLGKLAQTQTGTRRDKEDGGTRYYLWTSISASKAIQGTMLISGMKPVAVWINGKPVAPSEGKVELKAGANSALLRYDQPGMGYFVVVEPDSKLASEPSSAGLVSPTIGPLAMRWYGAKGLLPFDVRPQEVQPAGWYRFKSPPGTKAISITATGRVQCWVSGREIVARGENQTRQISSSGNASIYRYELPEAIPGEAVVAVRIEQVRGLYGGAALPEPVSFEVGDGVIQLGDWSKLEGFESYSGGLWYRKSVTLTAEQIKHSVLIDLGDVAASAEVHVNGELAGVRVAPPWRWDITRLIKPGENRIEVLVYNTLANHYLTIPTRYRGKPTSGLLGPVKLIIE